jgi:hypothetical protein
MGANCCSNDKDKTELYTQRKVTQKQKGANDIENDDLLFGDEYVVIKGIEGDLYSDYGSVNSSDDEDSDTNWECNERDLTFTRRGKVVNMFKLDILDEALEFATPELREVFEKYGPLKTMPIDIPVELNIDEIEYRNEGCKSEAGDVYVGEFRIGTNIREGRGLLISSENYIYEGYWVDDRKFGYGRILIANGSAYQGEFEEDVSNGKGIYATLEGLIYKGEWKNNK